MKKDRWGARHDYEIDLIDRDRLAQKFEEHMEPDHVCDDECPYFRADGE